MKLAIICPIGNLDCHGYQHVYQTCIASMAAFADAIYVPHSTRNRAGVDELIMTYDDIVYIGDERTWFEMGESGERFDLLRLRENVNLALDMARADGFDVALCVEVNQYVPIAAREPLRKECELVLAMDQPYGWLYRRDQLASVTFHASLRRPWIFNLAYSARLEIPDGAKVGDGPLIQHARGNWPEDSAVAVVDCALEMSMDDLRDKLEFFRFYSEFVSKRPTRFDWAYWREYSVNKFRQKQPDKTPLDLYGQAVAECAGRHPEFLSHEVLSLI